MLITGTSDKIQFKLGSTAATELPFTVDYNNYTATGVTLVSNNGTSNDTSAVDLVASPSSGQQNELRYCSIYNADSVTQTVIIQVYDGANTRIVFRAVLGVGDMLQYQLEKGWEVLDSLGNKKTYSYSSFPNTINGTSGWRPISAASSGTPTSTIVYFANLGKAERSYTSIDIAYNVTAIFSALTWAELAIYSGPRQPGDGHMPFIRRGFTDISGVITSTGVKKTTISVSGISTGELITLAFGFVGTAGSLRQLGLTAIDLADTTFGSIGNNTLFRPSLNNYLYYGAYNQITWWFNWQAT